METGEDKEFLDRDTRIAVQFDPRLADVWLSAIQMGVEPSPELVCLVRMAYVRGYQDSIEEPSPGELFRSLGIKVPKGELRVRPRKGRQGGSR